MAWWCSLVLFTLYFLINTSLCQQDCPALCSCYNKTVQCSNTSLHELPTDLPYDILHLNLANNNISAIWEDAFHNYSSLIELDLSYNNLDTLHLHALRALTQLQELHLEGNQLGRVPWEALNTLPNLRSLYLDDNGITHLVGLCETANATQGNESTINVTLTACVPRAPNLVNVYLANNHISELPGVILNSLPSLQTLNLDSNHLTGLPLNVSTSNLLELSLANNVIDHLDKRTFVTLPNLSTLNLRGNKLAFLNEGWLYHISAKTILLDGNPITILTSRTFTNMSNLQVLSLRGMPYLTSIGEGAFSSLSNLRSLNLSFNPRLHFIHAHAFISLPSLVFLDLTEGNLTVLHEDTFTNLTSLEQLWLEGNPWACNCASRWMLEWARDNSTLLNSSLTCVQPDWLHSVPFRHVLLENITCQPPSFPEPWLQVNFVLGSSAVLDCVSGGDPKPNITWITPHGRKTLHHHPAFSVVYEALPQEAEYHEDHRWHLHPHRYIHNLSHHTERIHILQNGSLFIDYVQRHDAGEYHCFVNNEYGNSTLVVQFTLNYQRLKSAVVISIAIGFATAFAFTILGIIIAIIRHISEKCSPEEKQKRKGIREIIESLDQFKCDKIDQLSAYKTAKIDQLSAFKTAKVDKLRSYKKGAVTTLWQHMHGMREHYSGQMAKVKDNCQSQVEKLRDNYSNQVCRFKDYKSHQVEKIRDNYNSQVMRIREYGSFQAARLREQYKLQQQYLMKILEVMDIGNCMSVIEAECMRTESMLFDPDLHLDFDTHPVHISRYDSDTNSDSEYQTAGSQSSSSDLREFGPATLEESLSATHGKKHRRSKLKGVNSLSQDSLDTAGQERVRPHRKRKRRRLHFIDELYRRAMKQKALAEAELPVHVHRVDDSSPNSEVSADFQSVMGSRDPTPDTEGPSTFCDAPLPVNEGEQVAEPQDVQPTEEETFLDSEDRQEAHTAIPMETEGLVSQEETIV